MKTRNMKRENNNMILEIGCRFFLFILFIYLESVTPFIRLIQPEEMWLYKFPRTSSYFPVEYLWVMAIFGPFLTVIFMCAIRNDYSDLNPASKVFTLTFCLNGVLTNIIKVTVGRPRPDFFYRCFPDGISNGISNSELNCSGNLSDIIEGRKSFPSGHSSFSFACMGFIFLYLASKLNVFNSQGQGNSSKLLVTLSPLVIALLIAISRTCDYHHHWQDVTVGGILGLSVAYICFRQYFPPLTQSMLKNHSASNLSTEYVYEEPLTCVKSV